MSEKTEKELEASEFQRRRSAMRKSFRTSYMNNTKWREVIAVAVEHGCCMSVSDISNPCRYLMGQLKREQLAADHIKDPGFGGGPLLYKDIYALRIEKFESSRNLSTGAVELCDRKSTQFVAQLSAIGLVHIEETEEHISILGYSA